MAIITRKAYRCERCAHEWIPRDYTSELPKVCPKCKSAYWNTPRQRAKKD